MKKVFILTTFIVFFLSCASTNSIKASIFEKYDEFEGSRSLEMCVHSDSNEYYKKYKSLPFFLFDPNKTIFINYFSKAGKYIIYFVFGTTSNKTLYVINKVSVSFDGNISELILEGNPNIRKTIFNVYSVVDVELLSKFMESKIVRLKYYYQDGGSQIIELLPHQIEDIKRFRDYLFSKSLITQ